MNFKEGGGQEERNIGDVCEYGREKNKKPKGCRSESIKGIKLERKDNKKGG